MASVAMLSLGHQCSSSSIVASKSALPGSRSPLCLRTPALGLRMKKALGGRPSRLYASNQEDFIDKGKRAAEDAAQNLQETIADVGESLRENLPGSRDVEDAASDTADSAKRGNAGLKEAVQGALQSAGDRAEGAREGAYKAKEREASDVTGQSDDVTKGAQEKGGEGFGEKLRGAWDDATKKGKADPSESQALFPDWAWSLLRGSASLVLMGAVLLSPGTLEASARSLGDNLVISGRIQAPSGPTETGKSGGSRNVAAREFSRTGDKGRGTKESLRRNEGQLLRGAGELGSGTGGNPLDAAKGAVERLGDVIPSGGLPGADVSKSGGTSSLPGGLGSVVGGRGGPGSKAGEDKGRIEDAFGKQTERSQAVREGTDKAASFFGGSNEAQQRDRSAKDSAEQGLGVVSGKVKEGAQKAADTVQRTLQGQSALPSADVISSSVATVSGEKQGAAVPPGEGLSDLRRKVDNLGRTFGEKNEEIGENVQRRAVKAAETVSSQIKGGAENVGDVISGKGGEVLDKSRDATKGSKGPLASADFVKSTVATADIGSGLVDIVGDLQSKTQCGAEGAKESFLGKKPDMKRDQPMSEGAPGFISDKVSNPSSTGTPSIPPRQAITGASDAAQGKDQKEVEQVMRKPDVAWSADVIRRDDVAGLFGGGDSRKEREKGFVEGSRETQSDRMRAVRERSDEATRRFVATFGGNRGGEGMKRDQSAKDAVEQSIGEVSNKAKAGLKKVPDIVSKGQSTLLTLDLDTAVALFDEGGAADKVGAVNGRVEDSFQKQGQRLGAVREGADKAASFFGGSSQSQQSDRLAKESLQQGVGEISGQVKGGAQGAADSAQRFIQGEERPSGFFGAQEMDSTKGPRSQSDRSSPEFFEGRPSLQASEKLNEASQAAGGILKGVLSGGQPEKTTSYPSEGEDTLQGPRSKGDRTAKDTYEGRPPLQAAEGITEGATGAARAIKGAFTGGQSSLPTPDDVSKGAVASVGFGGDPQAKVAAGKGKIEDAFDKQTERSQAVREGTDKAASFFGGSNESQKRDRSAKDAVQEGIGEASGKAKSGAQRIADAVQKGASEIGDVSKGDQSSVFFDIPQPAAVVARSLGDNLVISGRIQAPSGPTETGKSGGSRNVAARELSRTEEKGRGTKDALRRNEGQLLRGAGESPVEAGKEAVKKVRGSFSAADVTNGYAGLFAGEDAKSVLQESVGEAGERVKAGAESLGETLQRSTSDALDKLRAQGLQTEVQGPTQLAAKSGSGKVPADLAKRADSSDRGSYESAENLAKEESKFDTTAGGFEADRLLQQEREGRIL